MTEFTSDLPKKHIQSNDQLVAYFDNTSKQSVEFAVNDFDSTVGFFLKRGFEEIAAKTVAQVLLTRAKDEQVKIFELLDRLGGLNKTQLTALIINIINDSRDKTSQLGFKTKPKVTKLEERNIGDTVTRQDRYSALDFQSVTNTKNIQIGLVHNSKVLLTTTEDEDGSVR